MLSASSPNIRSLVVLQPVVLSLWYIIEDIAQIRGGVKKTIITFALQNEAICIAPLSDLSSTLFLIASLPATWFCLDRWMLGGGGFTRPKYKY